MFLNKMGLSWLNKGWDVHCSDECWILRFVFLTGGFGGNDAARACCACAVAVTTRRAAGGTMAMKALRGMMNGAMNELSSAVSGSRPAPAAAPGPAGTAASREHAMAASRDYITQPRLSESVSPCREWVRERTAAANHKSAERWCIHVHP